MKKLKLEGRVQCYLCDEFYNWRESDSETKVYASGPGELENGVHVLVDAEVYTRCPKCGCYNKHLRSIDIIND